MKFDCFLHMVDSSHSDYYYYEKTVAEWLTSLKVDDLPTITVYNKKDAIVHKDFVPRVQHDALLISAFN